MGPSNQQRARWANRAVLAHAAATRTENESAETQLQDLLTNLRHWATESGLNFADVDANAAGQWAEEVEEEA